MTTRPSLRRIPWDRILLVVGGAVALAWAVGFLAGLVVRVWLRL
jgi:hypothetical protein